MYKTICYGIKIWYFPVWNRKTKNLPNVHLVVYYVSIIARDLSSYILLGVFPSSFTVVPFLFTILMSKILLLLKKGYFRLIGWTSWCVLFHLNLTSTISMVCILHRLGRVGFDKPMVWKISYRIVASTNMCYCSENETIQLEPGQNTALFL